MNTFQEPTAPNVLIYQIPQQNGAKLRFVTPQGKYLGSVEFDVVDAESLILVGNQFQAYAAQQAGGVQIATHFGNLRAS